MFKFITPAEVPFRAVLTGINAGPSGSGFVGQVVFSNLVVQTAVVATKAEAFRAAKDLASDLVSDRLISVA